MNMRIKGDEVAECLHVEDEGGLAMWLQGVEAGLDESCGQPAKLTEITATIAKERSGQLQQGEQILAVWHRREHVVLQPLAVGEHALLVTARTEVASLAGIGQQVVMAALIAEDSREPLMQVAAVEKAIEDLGLYRPLD
jgi:hypothetical protein